MLLVFTQILLFWGLFYFSILFANCIGLPDCWVLLFFSQTVWQIFFSSFYTSIQRLFRTGNTFITFVYFCICVFFWCIFIPIPRWRWRWWLWCLRNRFGKFTLVFRFFSFPIFSALILFCSRRFSKQSIFHIPFQVSSCLSLSSLVSPFFFSGYLLQYFLFEALLSSTVLGLPILLQRKYNWTVLWKY